MDRPQPGLRAAQAGATVPDDLGRNLNLFRGQLVFPLELVSLPGRNGLDLSVAGMYSSAVSRQVELRNRDAPTGTLGVGWSLGHEQIVLGDRLVALAEQQRIFLVDPTGVQALYRVGEADGMVTFQPREYQFWKIELIDVGEPARARWRVTRDDGSVRLFGGEGAVEWGASWDGWVGPSTATGSSPFPVAWNLAEIRSPEGDRISFSYEGEEVEIGGTPVTRGTRLARVVDAFERAVELDYREKESFENELPEAPPSWGEPAYQFSFQTQYLSSITVRERHGEVAFRQLLGYELLDVLRPPGEGRPEFTKRYLTSVRQELPGEGRLPAVTLGYERDPDAPAPGALIGQSFVTGARAGYSYSPAPIAHSTTELELDGPDEHRPRVWHGADFTVVTWQNEATGRLEVWVCAWSGVWRVWRDDALGDVDATDFSVVTGSELFAIRYRSSSRDRPVVRVYHEDPYRFGSWNPTDLDLGPEFAELRMASGGDFVALQGRGNAWMRIVSWDALRKRWREQDIDTPDASEVALGGGDGYVLGAFHSAGSEQLRLQIFFADLNGEWGAGGYTDVTQPVDWKLTNPESVWSSGGALGAATFVTGVEAGTVSAAVVLMRWRSSYALADVEVQEVTQPTDTHNPILYSVLVESLVGHAADATRFDAGSWETQRLVEPRSGGEYRYAYGSDLALVAERRDGRQRFAAQRYDPYAGSWTAEGVPSPSEIGGEGSLFAPAIAGRYAQLGRSVYARTAEGAWERIHDLPQSTIGESCALRSGGYLCYQREGGAGTEVSFFVNGEAREETLSLPGERSFVPAAGPGEVLAGPAALVTYRGESFDSARRLTLHRVIDAAMPSPPRAPVVEEATLDDGYARRSMRAEYEDAGAALDPTASTAQFTRVGVGWPSDPGRGRTLHTFYNGLDPDEQGAFYPADGTWSNARRYLSLLSGQIWKSETFDADGGLVSRVATLSWAYDRAEGPPGSVAAETAGEPELSNLAGIYTRPRRTERTLVLPLAQDGGATPVEVVSVETSDYNPMGQVETTTAFNVAPDGGEERLQTLTTYAWEVYDEIREANLLTPVAQTRRRNATTGTITGIDVTTYVDRWPSAGAASLWAQRDTYSWRGEKGTETFDFASWSDRREAPPGWLLADRVVDRSPRGAMLEQRDVDGVSSSAILDRDGVFPVARLEVTSRAGGEGWYWGFEPYEDPGPWAPSAPATLLEGTAFAGSRCLRVPGSTAASPGLTATLHLTADPGALMLACRSRTESGSGEGPIDAFWRVRAGGVTRERRAAASDGAWRLWHFPLHPRDFGLERFGEVEIELVNREADLDLLLDCLFCNPLIGDAEAAVYSEPHELEVARVPRLGSARWTLFDDLRRPIAAVGESFESTALTVAHEWPAHAERFDPARPNFDVEATVRTAGAYFNAVQGESLPQQWAVDGKWEREREILRPSDDGDGQILTAWTRSERTFALRARLYPEEGQPRPYGLRLGGASLVNRDGLWSLLDPDGEELAAAVAADPPARDLLALATDVGVQLFGDGRLLIDAAVGPLERGPLGVFAGGPVRVSNLLAADGIAAKATFRDNLMRPIQRQSLNEGGVIALALLLDGGARAAVQTRPLARAGRLLGFMTDLVTSFDWRSGLLAGAVADAHPEDEGYPYGRERYDATPLARPVETGLPGRALAIDERVPARERHTQRTLYEATGAAADALALPAGGFSVTTSIDQDGVRTRRANDRLGRSTIEVRDSVADPAAHPETRTWEYDEAGRLRTLRLPNSFDPSHPDAERFRERFSYDFLGRLIEREQPDMDAPAQSVYDAAGRVRFALDASGLAAGTFSYCRYDRLGRLLEDGVCWGAWDRATLQAGAEDRDWLPDESEALNLRAYDGDGEDPYAVGQLVEALARRPGDAAGEGVEEAFRYDPLGRLTERSQTIRPAGDGTDRVRVAYDLQGSVVEQSHVPPAGDAFSVYDVLDPWGQLVRLQGRTGAGPAEALATYAYTAEGQIESETLGPAAPAPLARRYSYGPAGWLAGVEDACFSQRVDYEGSFAGRVTGTEERFADPPAIAGFVGEFETAIEYDPHGRLLSVDNSAGEEYGVGTVAPLSYDRNGNLVSLSRGSTVQRHLYAEGTNRLAAVEDVAAYGYDRNGALDTATSLGIAAVRRHPTSGQPLELDLEAGESVGFGYAADGRRVLERGAGATVVVVHDAAGRPFARRVHKDGSSQAIHYLHGPNGLAAARTAARSLFVLRDRLGSVRGVYDGERLVAAASYQPLGDALGPRWIQPDLASLLPQGFTGQQLGPPDGLVLFPARMYDPFVARFDRIDPVGRHPSPYAYVGGDPLGYVDPNGEDLLGVLLGIFFGAALIAGGVALIVASGGAATPGVAAAWSVGGSFLLGAGAASVGYGLEQTASDRQFKPGEWVGLTVLGGLFGAISGGLTSATAALASQAAATATRAFAVELSLGVVMGGAEGFVSNGVVNVSNGRSFDDRWLGSLLGGGGGGAFGGAIGGFSGRLLALRNVRTLSAMGPREASISTHRIMSKHWPSHNVVWLGGEDAFDLTLPQGTGFFDMSFRSPPATFGVYENFEPGRGIRGRLRVSQGAHEQALAFANGLVNTEAPYSFLSNSCTTKVIDVVAQTGVVAPPWAYSPTTLVWWTRRLPQ